MSAARRFTGMEWREDGFFRCGDNHVCVKGVAGDVHALAEFARRAGVLSSSRVIYEASDAFDDIGYNEDAWTSARDFEAEFQYKRSDEGRPAQFFAQMRRIAAQLPTDRKALESVAETRAAQLNAVAPLVESPRLFDNYRPGGCVADGVALRGFAGWVDWIDPALIVSTRASAWNAITRTPARDSVIAIAEGLASSAASSAGMDRWLAQMSSAVDPVVAFRIEGPAGPIYEVDRGTHRAHASRLFWYPFLLAHVKAAALPVALHPTREMSARWSGLVERGLLQAEESGGRWYVRSVPAEWMLAAARVATQINAAYDIAYPGVLSKVTGLQLDELTNPRRWQRALVRRT